jgi:hypothetical protein
VDGVLVLAGDKSYGTKYGARDIARKGEGPISPKDLPGFIQSNATHLVAF